MMQAESKFTKPTDLCPHPEWWTSNDDPDPTENEVSEMVYGIVRGLQPRYCLETGTAFGHTAVRIGEALEKNRHGTLVTIEQDSDRFSEFVRLTRQKDLPVVAYNGSSLSWDNDLDFNLVFDFCFFDSFYKLRVKEFHHFRRWMRIGTIVAFHDTAPGHGRMGKYPDSDLRSVLMRELRSEMRLINLPTPRGLTLGEVFR